MIAVLSLAWASSFAQDDDHYGELRNLDDRIQSIKRQALELGLAARAAETRWLYPDEQRTRLFLTMDVFDFELTDLSIRINGVEAVEHQYSAREVYALKRGGVQPLLLTNLAPGRHRLEATFGGYFGRRGDKAPRFEKPIELSFQKGQAPQQLELRIEPRARRQDLEIRVFSREQGE